VNRKTYAQLRNVLILQIRAHSVSGVLRFYQGLLADTGDLLGSLCVAKFDTRLRYANKNLLTGVLLDYSSLNPLRNLLNA
jgi:hypothetical protein